MDISWEKSYPTPVSNSTLLPLLLMSLSMQKHTPARSTFIKQEYDYIVVGGGAAGSAIASRLSEAPCVTVLLIEAGGEPPLLTEVPSLARYFFGTDIDWQFRTVPQKYAAEGLVDQIVPIAGGKVLGGAATINSMLYVRGNKKDYDYWESIGCKGWGYDDVFQYFVKLEDFTTPYLTNGYHGTGGPITVENQRYKSELEIAVAEAGPQMGYEFVDPNGEKQSGFFVLQSNIRNNQRCSSVKGYLVPAENRTNLDIVMKAYVTRIIFEDGRASAVEFFDGEYRHINVRKEVIVTAGAINTPKILMLSGVGPKEELDKFNIPVVADLPVGKNFHNHCGSNLFFTIESSIRRISEKQSDTEVIEEYINSRSGLLASTDFLINGFLHGSHEDEAYDFPNFEFYIAEVDSLYATKLRFKPEVYRELFTPYEKGAIYRCISMDLQTKSRGTVTLQSSNPFDPPLIDPNYFEHPKDLEDVVDGLKFCKRLLETEPLKKIGAQAFETVVPGCEMYAHDETEYLRCYASATLNTFHHIVGSAKMGDPFDPTTVVDPELRVKGVQGLRVADASIMPQVISANTHVTVMMIAEKAADMIKNTIHEC